MSINLTSIKQKLKKTFTIRNINVAVVVFILAFLGYILFAPLTPAVFKSITIHDPNHLEAGSTLTYDLDRCRYVTENVSTQIIRNLVATDSKGVPLKNTFSISLSSDFAANPKGCGVTTRTVLLPSNIPAGYYRLKIVSIYSVIPIRHPTVVIKMSEKFKIQPPTVSEQINLLNQQLDLLRQAIEAQGGIVPDGSSEPPLTQSQTGGSGNTSTSPQSKATTTPSNGGSSSSAPPPSNGSGGSDNSPPPPVNNPVQDILNQVKDLVNLGVKLEL